MSDRPNPRYLVSSEQVRGAYFLGGIGAVALILGVLLLASARPQGNPVTVDDAQYQLQLQAAEADLTGFELIGDGARIDIGHAMQLVVDRGVDLPLYAGGAAPAAAAEAPEPAADASAEIVAQADVDGAALYTQHCMACHQATGAGIPGAFPPIAGHVGEVVAVDRAYPAKLVLFGMMGAIEVQGTSYNGVMPGLAAALSDADVAGILNHVLTAWDDVEVLGDAFEPYTAEEVAEWRAAALQMTDVYALRQELAIP
jgi:mono/diheme cytochrome c family protein